jgi:hypothetical protein
LKLSPDRHKQTFANLTFSNLFRVRCAIGKNNEAGSIARLDNQFALPVASDDFLNFPGNIQNRADDKRQR